MTGTVERFHARSYWPALIAAWAIFLSLIIVAVDPLVEYVIAVTERLAAAWPSVIEPLATASASGWTAIISVEILVLGLALVAIHEAGHILAHRLMGTSADRIRIERDGINMRILVAGFESRKTKLITTAAPLAVTVLPAAVGLAMAAGHTWAGFFACALALAWGICISDINVLINYLNIPPDAMVCVRAGGEITEWYIPDGGR
jgi:hypothetical protein